MEIGLYYHFATMTSRDYNRECYYVCIVMHFTQITRQNVVMSSKLNIEGNMANQS